MVKSNFGVAIPRNLNSSNVLLGFQAGIYLLANTESFFEANVYGFEFLAQHSGTIDLYVINFFFEILKYIGLFF